MESSVLRQSLDILLSELVGRLEAAFAQLPANRPIEETMLQAWRLVAQSQPATKPRITRHDTTACQIRAVSSWTLHFS